MENKLGRLYFIVESFVPSAYSIVATPNASDITAAFLADRHEVFDDDVEKRSSDPMPRGGSTSNGGTRIPGTVSYRSLKPPRRDPASICEFLRRRAARYFEFYISNIFSLSYLYLLSIWGRIEAHACPFVESFASNGS